MMNKRNHPLLPVVLVLLCLSLLPTAAFAAQPACVPPESRPAILSGPGQDGQHSLDHLYGYSRLTGDTARSAYTAMLTGFAQHEASIDLSALGLDTDAVKTIYAIIRNEHPQLYGLRSISIGRRGSVVTSVRPIYENAVFDDSAFAAGAAGLLRAAEGLTGQYDQALALHDALIQHTAYDLSAANAHNAYGAIVEGKAVCDGYARAYQYLLQQLDIQSYVVTGTSGGGGHAWNLVRLDGKYYHVDVTFDDPVSADDTDKPIFHPCFAVSDEAIAADHTVTTAELPLEPCPESRLHPDYVSLSTLTPEAVAAAVQVRDGEASARIYYTGSQPFDVWCRADSGHGTTNLQRVIQLSGHPVQPGASISLRNCGREWRITYGVDLPFGRVSAVSDAGLTVKLNLPVQDGNLIAAGYDHLGRLVSVGSCRVSAGDKVLTVTGRGFDAAAAIRLFLTDGGFRPLYRAAGPAVPAS